MVSIFVISKGDNMARNLKNLLKLVNQTANKIPVEKSFLQDLKRSIELTDEKSRTLLISLFPIRGVPLERLAISLSDSSSIDASST